VRVRRGNQGGFTLIESILSIILLVGLVFVVYHFGWGTTSKAGATLRENDIKTIEQAVGAYILNSNGLYPTDDGKRPEGGENKLIIWDASFTASRKQLSFYPDFLNKLPRHWNEGVWWIDSLGKVSVTVNPEDY
jgi:type II secretory pathway pseudopilin PulG